MVMSLIAGMVTKVLGRKTLLMLGCIICIVSHATLGICSYMYTNDHEKLIFIDFVNIIYIFIHNRVWNVIRTCRMVV